MSGAGLLILGMSCQGPTQNSSPQISPKMAVGQPNAGQMPLDPTTIPQFVTQLPIPKVYAPTVIRNGLGQIIRNEYTVTDSQVLVQMLPAGFPATNVLAMGGTVFVSGTSGATQTLQSVPAPVFENLRGTPTVVHWRTNVGAPNFMPVDPTIPWANPQAIEEPLPPFALFPPGYPNGGQYPVAHVTHTHGLMVLPQMDGTADEWFTNAQYRGPSFVTQDYTMPNDQPATQLFYHDHVLGVTRLGVYEGEVGTAYFIRDPSKALDAPSSPLPPRQFEIPLVLSTKAFFTDGELNFPPDRGSLNAGADAPPQIAYWSYNEGADTVTVNGAAWPNLNVQRRQYRFRVLGAANTELWDIQLVNQTNSAVVPITIVGSDGGYLPAPQVVSDVQIGITERADILVDFSVFPAGTKIQMNNNYVGDGSRPTLFNVMQFTVQAGTAVHPPTLSPSLFPPRAVLTADAPTRFKVLRVFDDIRDVNGNCSDPALLNCNQRTIDGIEFSSPATELPLVGSTEEWDIIHMMEPRNDDQDNNFHQIHIHLLEFQVLNRQPFDSVSYRNDWHRLNGHMPTTRPIVLSPTPYFTGPAVAPAPYETGWKDTFQAMPAMVNRIMVRWAPQEATSSTPGVNQFSIDPTAFPDNVKGPGYVWHCHIVGHEDHDMLRQLGVVNLWKANTAYRAGNVVALSNIDYRARVNHTSTAGQTPNIRFDLWDRVNNNDGTWQPQIRYALGDRVLSGGLLYAARSVFQAQNGQTPAANPTLWQALPNTACGQLAQFCQGNTNPNAVACRSDGIAGVEATCLAEMEPCLSYCQPQQLRPCGGLCNNPVVFSVADGGNFQSGNLGTGETCFETHSRLFQGESSSFVAPRQLTVNGRVEPLNGNWNYPLPPLRNDGYCIQISAGQNPWAAFAAW